MYTSFLLNFKNFKNLLIDNYFLERESLFNKSEEEIGFLDSKLMDGCRSNLKKKLLNSSAISNTRPSFFGNVYAEFKARVRDLWMGTAEANHPCSRPRSPR